MMEIPAIWKPSRKVLLHFFFFFCIQGIGKETPVAVALRKGSGKRCRQLMSVPTWPTGRHAQLRCWLRGTPGQRLPVLPSSGRWLIHLLGGLVSLKLSRSWLRKMAFYEMLRVPIVRTPHYVHTHHVLIKRYSRT